MNRIRKFIFPALITTVIALLFLSFSTSHRGAQITGYSQGGLCSNAQFLAIKQYNKQNLAEVFEEYLKSKGFKESSKPHYSGLNNKFVNEKWFEGSYENSKKFNVVIISSKDKIRECDFSVHVEYSMQNFVWILDHEEKKINSFLQTLYDLPVDFWTKM